MRRTRSVLVSLLATLLCGACGSSLPEANPTPATIEVFPSGPLIVRQGDAVPLSFIVRDRTGQGLFAGAFDFRTTDAGVATVAMVGPSSYERRYELRAVSPGTAVITVSTGEAARNLVVSIVTWPRIAMSGPAFGAAARSGTALVTTLDGHVHRLDPASGMVVATYDYYSAYVAFSNDGARAYFANAVFDLATQAELHPLFTDPNVECGQITAARERVGGGVIYLGCSTGVVSVNPTTGTALSTIPTPYPVLSLAQHPTDPRLYASVPTAGRVYEISTQSNTLIRELPILGGPRTAVLPGGNEIIVAMEGDHQIERWDLGGPTPTDSLPLQLLPQNPSPFDIVESADGVRLLASAGNFVLELDRSTLGVKKKYWVGGIARRIGVADGRAVVANEGGWVDLLPF